jgi:hypothetical protein
MHQSGMHQAIISIATFSFDSISCIRFKGYNLSPLKDTPKVSVNLGFFNEIKISSDVFEKT